MTANRGEVSGVSPQERAREVAWRQAHEQELRRFVVEWVVLEGESLIALGPDPGPLVMAARARGIQVPYVFFVEPIDDRAARVGL